MKTHCDQWAFYAFKGTHIHNEGIAMHYTWYIDDESVDMQIKQKTNS